MSVCSHKPEAQLQSLSRPCRVPSWAAEADAKLCCAELSVRSMGWPLVYIEKIVENHFPGKSMQPENVLTGARATDFNCW